MQFSQLYQQCATCIQRRHLQTSLAPNSSLHGNAARAIRALKSGAIMAVYLQFKDKGIEFAREAVTEDEAGNHDKALQMYLGALEYFKTYLKYEKNPKAREAITGKVRDSAHEGSCRDLRRRWGGRDPQTWAWRGHGPPRLAVPHAKWRHTVQRVPGKSGVPEGRDGAGQQWA
jgi:vacuolar protein-sorting-associated protein 4